MTDVALVGLGAACGVAAHVLTEAGLDVVALEAGPRREAAEMTQDEIRNDTRSWLSEPKSGHEVPTYRTSAVESAGPSPWPTLMVNAVGGTTVHYPALSIRLQPWNFRSRSATLERYGAAAIPEGSTMTDWPLDYAELEPYYDVVERAIGVGGEDANPYDGPRSGSYPLPPLRRSGWNELTAAAARELGWHPFQAPAAVNTAPYDGRPVCTYCGFCSGNGCYANAKGSADVTVIPRAEATGRLRVETGARVLRIETGEHGRVTGVTYTRDGREQFQEARAVLLGAFVYETVRLLLLSTSLGFPHGLANNAGRVGKDYTAHVTPVVFGHFPGRTLNVHNGLWAQATCVDDWNADNFDHTGLGFVGGGMLSAPQEAKPIATASAPTPPGVPRWGEGWRQWLRESGPSLGYAVAQFDALTYDGTELDLDPAVTDPDGVPVVRITHSVRGHEQRGHDFLRGKLETWLTAAGAERVWPLGTTFVEARHCYGGTRMGDDPARSVVDRFGFAHEVPNLGVVGASVFPSAGGANPTLTVQALAWRTAANLVETWGNRV